MNHLFRYRHESMASFYLRRMRDFAMASIPWFIGLALVALIAWELFMGIPCEQCATIILVTQ